MAFWSLKLEAQAHQIARLERYRALGWWRFSIAFTAILSCLAYALLFFIIHYSWMVRLRVLMLLIPVLIFLMGQVIWWTLDGQLERLRESDDRRKVLWKEGNAFYGAGLLMAALVATLPFYLGRAAAAPDLMLTITGTVIAIWGVWKLYRYWSSTPQWAACSLWERAVRFYGNALFLAAFVIAFIARAYACYGSAPWAEPVRQLMNR